MHIKILKYQNLVTFVLDSIPIHSIFIDEGIRILDKKHKQKASSPIEVTDEGIDTCFKFKQL